MDIEQIRAKLYDDFDADGIVTRQRKQAKNQPIPSSGPIDLYERNRERARENSRKMYPKGASPAVNMSTYAVIDGLGGMGLAKAYKKAKCDIELLKSRGERERAELARQQYMQENFLPAVEIVVNSSSPDEVLNSKTALKELDKYSLLEGSGDGYTAQYIRQAYGNQLGNKEGRSNDVMRSEIMRINALLDDGQIRTAFSLAQKLKDKIDNGLMQSDDIDYETLGRIVSYYSV